jgi:hypothetical protein
MIEPNPENLMGDRAYDSDPLDEELRRDGIEIDRAIPRQSQQAAYARSTPSSPLYAPWPR